MNQEESIKCSIKCNSHDEHFTVSCRLHPHEFYYCCYYCHCYYYFTILARNKELRDRKGDRRGAGKAVSVSPQQSKAQQGQITLNELH